MALKIKKGKPRGGAQRFPVTYDVLFTGTPKTGEIGQTREKVEKSMRRDKTAKVKKGASKRFKLTFKWTRTDIKTLRYDLLVDLVKDERFGDSPGNGGEVPPKPKSSILPM